jgi:hypothetical protein
VRKLFLLIIKPLFLSSNPLVVRSFCYSTVERSLPSSHRYVLHLHFLHNRCAVLSSCSTNTQNKTKTPKSNPLQHPQNEVHNPPLPPLRHQHRRTPQQDPPFRYHHRTHPSAPKPSHPCRRRRAPRHLCPQLRRCGRRRRPAIPVFKRQPHRHAVQP